ncbi:MAG: 50S ribosomal protein L23 [Desulfovibrionaceae bacterium]|nr:50S ribosomal protein L23 [Desulfovibrionaceae bacterium]
MEYANLLIKPVISEKAVILSEQENTYLFYVLPSANKIEIKKAVEHLFSVNVVSVRIMRRKSEPLYRQGRKRGKVSGYKKAYITLAHGETLSFYDGV